MVGVLYIAMTGLEFRDPPASTKLKMWTTTSNLELSFNFYLYVRVSSGTHRSQKEKAIWTLGVVCHLTDTGAVN